MTEPTEKVTKTEVTPSNRNNFSTINSSPSDEPQTLYQPSTESSNAKNESTSASLISSNTDGGVTQRSNAIVKITVLGSGSFGTALGAVLARNGHEICILTRYPDVVEEITVGNI